MERIKQAKKGEIAILVDTDTAKENVSRAATSEGWKVKGIKAAGTGYRIMIAK